MEFKDRIFQLRTESNMTGQQLGEKLFVSKSAISHWESGRSEPTINVMIQIANLFNVSLDYLLGRSNERIVNPEDKEKIDKGLLIITNAGDLDDEDRKQINDFVEFLKSKK